MALVATRYSEGFTTVPGVGESALYSVVYDAVTTATGDAIDLTDDFAYVYSVEVVGMGTIGLAAYTPQFINTPSAAHSATSLKMVMMMIPLLEIDDTVDISAQGLTPADGVDLQALDPIYIKVTGKRA